VIPLNANTQKVQQATMKNEKYGFWSLNISTLRKFHLDLLTKARRVLGRLITFMRWQELPVLVVIKDYFIPDKVTVKLQTHGIILELGIKIHLMLALIPRHPSHKMTTIQRR